MTPPLVCLPARRLPPPKALMVDDCADPGGAMVIDHHVDHTTPASYRTGRTATERVLNALEDGLRPSDFDCVVVRHYDADGVLAVWAVQNPETARAHARTLIDAAAYGDFFTGPPEARQALGLSLAVQEALPRDLANGRGRDRWFAPRIGVGDLYDAGLGRIGTLLHGEPLPVSAEGLLRQFDEELCHARLVGGPVPVIQLGADALLHAVMAADQSPVVVTASPFPEGDRWGYSVMLRPEYGWGYSEDAVGPVPLRSLDGLAGTLATLERETCGTLARWEERRFDGTSWRLDCRKRGSRLLPDALAAGIAAWIDRICPVERGAS